MHRVIVFVLILPVWGFALSCYAQRAQEDSLLQLISKTSPEKNAYLYNQLSDLKFDGESFDSAAAYARKALDMARQHNLEEEAYFALSNLAFIHYDLGEIDTSIFFASEALDIAQQMDNQKLIARTLNHLGNAYSKISAFDKSLQCFLTSLQIVEDTLPDTSPDRNEFYRSMLLNNIGTVYKNMKQPQIALDYFRQSLLIRQKQNDLSGIATCLQNIGVIYENEGRFDTTLMLYQEALQIRDSLGQRGFSAELLVNMGVIYTKTGQYPRAEQFLTEGMGIFESLDKKRFLTFTYLNLARLYIKTRQSARAFSYLEKCIEMARQFNYRVYERDALEMLTEYYRGIGDYKKALNHQSLQMALNDSIFSAEMSSRVAEISAMYHTDQMEKEIEILSKDNEIQLLKIKRRTTLLYVMVVVALLFVLLLMVALLLLNRRRLKQKQIKTELEKSKLIENSLKEQNAYQSKQLTTHALNMLQKNKLLQELDAALKSFAPRADDGLKKKLAEIRRQVNRNMNSENDWDLFRLYFEEVNKDFYVSLQKISGELTPGDIKLAALIKLNLNIKEAAAVLNISPDSLRKARYRLRQKLGLTERENLADFLSRID